MKTLLLSLLFIVASWSVQAQTGPPRIPADTLYAKYGLRFGATAPASIPLNYLYLDGTNLMLKLAAGTTNITAGLGGQMTGEIMADSLDAATPEFGARQKFVAGIDLGKSGTQGQARIYGPSGTSYAAIIALAQGTDGPWSISIPDLTQSETLGTREYQAGRFGLRAIDSTGIGAGKMFYISTAGVVAVKDTPNYLIRSSSGGVGKYLAVFDGTLDASGQRLIKSATSLDGLVNFIRVDSNAMFLYGDGVVPRIYFHDLDNGNRAYVGGTSNYIEMGPDVNVTGNLAATSFEGAIRAQDVLSGTLPWRRLSSDLPTNGQVLTYSSALDSAVWGAGGSGAGVNYAGVVDSTQVLVRDSARAAGTWRALAQTTALSLNEYLKLTSTSGAGTFGRANLVDDAEYGSYIRGDQEEAWFRSVNSSDDSWAGFSHDAALGDGLISTSALGDTVTFSSFIENDKTFVLGTESDVITTGQKIAWRAPYNYRIVRIYGGLNTASSSGSVTIDMEEGGTTMLSGAITFTSGSTTTETYTLSDTYLAKGSLLTLDVDEAGTGAVCPKITVTFVRQ